MAASKTRYVSLIRSEASEARRVTSGYHAASAMRRNVRWRAFRLARTEPAAKRGVWTATGRPWTGRRQKRYAALWCEAYVDTPGDTLIIVTPRLVGVPAARAATFVRWLAWTIGIQGLGVA